MMKKDVCCYCNELSQFCSRVNGGENYYCNRCIQKIEESEIDYWKECSFGEFLGKISKDTSDSETPFADHIRGIWKEMGYDVPERKRRKKKSK